MFKIPTYSHQQLPCQIGTAARRSLLRVPDAIAVHPVGEGLVVAETQQSGGLCLVVAGMNKRPFDVMPRYLSHQRFQLDARVERLIQDVVLTVQHPRRAQNRIADRLQAYGFVVGPNSGALQGVEQLANIARPGMLQQKVSCGSR